VALCADGVPTLLPVVVDVSAWKALHPQTTGSRQAFAVSTAFPFHLRDAETGTLWDLTGAAISGPRAGSRLEPVATYSAMWFAWAAFNRDTELFAP
jgi:hypothetical protein